MYTIYMHVGTQKSIILREGYAAVFYVIQGAKRRIISLRASKSEALSYRMTGRCTRGKDREPFDGMTEIGGFDLQEWRTPLLRRHKISKYRHFHRVVKPFAESSYSIPSRQNVEEVASPS